MAGDQQDPQPEFEAAITCPHNGGFSPCKWRPATASHKAGYVCACNLCGQIFPC